MRPRLNSSWVGFCCNDYIQLSCSKEGAKQQGPRVDDTAQKTFQAVEASAADRSNVNTLLQFCPHTGHSYPPCGHAICTLINRKEAMHEAKGPVPVDPRLWERAAWPDWIAEKTHTQSSISKPLRPISLAQGHRIKVTEIVHRPTEGTNPSEAMQSYHFSV
jgi:hypothetical protein